MPPAAAPPAPPPPPEPDQSQGQGGPAAGRLLQAQARELEALRRRVAGVPEPEELEALRAKAAQFDALQQRLPELQERITATFQQQAAQAEQQRLAAAVAQAFTAAGGLSEWAEAFAELHQGKVSRAANGDLVLAGPDGTSQPLAQALDGLRTHPQWSHTFRPMFGSGSGLAPSAPSRSLPHAPDLAKLTTRQKFDLAYGGGGPQ